jgi:hypothetical protein
MAPQTPSSRQKPPSSAPRNKRNQNRDPAGAASDEQPSNDPQLRRVHESAGSDDELGRRNDTSIEQGGSRHRNQ